jgi:hypothetical protein
MAFLETHALARFRIGRLIGMTLLLSTMASIWSAQCCISLVRGPIERSNLVIDRLDALLVEIGQAQLDYIAIPQLVVVPVDLWWQRVEKVLRKPWAQCSAAVS